MKVERNCKDSFKESQKNLERIPILRKYEKKPVFLFKKKKIIFSQIWAD